MDKQNALDLSLKESNFLKGIALLLLLIHHLFYIQNGQYDDVTIIGYGAVHIFGLFCKVCVAIFVFLSGYACAKTTQIASASDVWNFYKRRLKKLFLNYWFIWLLFVPVGMIVFGRTFTDVYREPRALNFILDFFGLLNITGQYGYNPTWWFYSCILGLYFLFPVLCLIVTRWPRAIFVLLVAGFALSCVPGIRYIPFRYYTFAFIAGMALNIPFINHRLSACYRYMGGVFPLWEQWCCA